MAKTSKKKKSGAEVEWAPMPSADAERFAASFKALGDPTRLRIVLFLQRTADVPIPELDAALGDTGNDSEDEDGEIPAGLVTVGDIACHLTGSGKVSSNVSHHLKELRHAGLVEMRRRGKNIFCRLEGEAVHLLGRLLTGTVLESMETTARRATADAAREGE